MMRFKIMKPRHIIFYICTGVYAVNLICIILSGNYLFLKTTGFYNAISLIFDALFLFIFYTYLKKGSITSRYVYIMFIGLVLIPFLIALLSSGVKF